MTDIIQELRGLLADERKALRDMKESGAPNDALLDAWLKASGRLNQASTAALPALLDRLEAAEPWRKHYFDMAKAAGDLKASVRPQLDAMPFADHADVRKAFNDIAIVAGRALDHMQPKDAPAIREVKP
ncbi:hypothetical protein [Sphingobium yanoikuyae]|uniref:hypothetical protein n=1 Tax=Sphingobium yanoikuyae TaxID=13690 RepID=UPI003EFDD8A2